MELKSLLVKGLGATKAMEFKRQFSAQSGQRKQTMQTSVKARKEKIDGKEEHVLTIKFSDYTVIDNSRDLMLKGAFNNSFERNGDTNRKIAFLWQHDRRDPIGRILKYWEDDEGAYVDVVLSDFDAVPNAKRAWVQTLDGTLNQASFGFDYIWDSVKYVAPAEDEEFGHFAVGDVELYEISIVTLGDNPNTSISVAEQSTWEGYKHLHNLMTKENIIAALSALEDTDVIEFYKGLGITLEEKPKGRGLFGRANNQNV